MVTTGKVCFICYFIEGSQARGCYIEYKCLSTDFNGNVTIVRKSVNTSTASKCATGIYTSNYNVTFYDMKHNNHIYMEDCAVKLSNQFLSGISLTSIPHETDLILPSPSPTTIQCTDCDNSELLYYNIII